VEYPASPCPDAATTSTGAEEPERQDAYRCLEDTNQPAVRDWVQAQHDLAEHALATLPARQAFRDRLTRLWDHPRRGVPSKRGDRWFQLRNDGLQDQDVLWSAPAGADPDHAPDDGWTVLLDVNPLSDDGTVSLAQAAVSDDGTLLAYGLSEAGSDWTTWRVRDTATGADRDDVVRWSKFSRAAWLPDASGFVYGRYDAPEPGQEFAAANRDMRLHLHRLGTSQDDDPVVYERPDQPEWGFDPQVTHDGAFLVVTVFHGTRRETRLHLASISDRQVGPVRPLLDAGDAAYEFLGAVDGHLLVLTDHGAPRGRVIRIDPDTPGDWVEVVGQRDDLLLSAQVVGAFGTDDPGWLVCHWLHHATAHVTVHDVRTGIEDHAVLLPGLGTVEAIAGGRRQRAIHLTYETFEQPKAVLRHDLVSRDTTEVVAPGAPAPEVLLVTEQVRVVHTTSADGRRVEVPLFLVHRGDVVPDGTVPTVLWGYGGFGIPVTPMFRAAFRAWVDAGGLLAVASLRGGGEYGTAWHDDGRLDNKQHVFDDAIACARWLAGDLGDGEVSAIPGLQTAHDVDVIWSRPDRIGIEGRSNGGLLAGACLTQAPERFGSAVPEVGVLDLVRFHLWTIGWAWMSDYGNPGDPDDRAVQLAYSPYHNLQAGTAYPPTLITTGDTDDRVHPAHSFKFAAALQAAQGGDAPVLLRVDMSAGHGAGKPIGKLVAERADVLAFHAHHLGLDVTG
jgi:prolyl oligopeptidase